MNNRQKAQIVFASIFAILLIGWFFFPGWSKGKILGIIGNVFSILCMVFSYLAEEKKKKEKNP